MCSKVEDTQIRKVQKQILKGLVEVKRICEKYDLKFYLVGGSALGAIRHEGFIPWDDDADIGMPREDYDKFISICRTELDSAFFLQTATTDKEYYLPYAKLRLKNTKYVLQSSKNFNMHHGIFIDIFPLDGISSNYVKRWRQKYIVDFLTKLRNVKIFNPNKGTFEYYIREFLSSLFSFRLINRIIIHEITIAKNETTNYMGNLLGLYGYDKEVFMNEVFGEPYQIMFEGELFPIPKQYKTFLKQLYGEYMVLPPIEKRVGHIAIYVEINNNYEEE